MRSDMLICRDFLGGGRTSTRSGADAEVLCDAKKTTKNPPFAGLSSLLKPSDGLEPSTPSLPWRFRAAACDLGTPLGSAACLQSGPFLRFLHPTSKDPEPPRRASNLSPEPSPNGIRTCRRRWQQVSVARESARTSGTESPCRAIGSGSHRAPIVSARRGTAASPARWVLPFYDGCQADLDPAHRRRVRTRDDESRTERRFPPGPSRAIGEC
jgi:hypothetical protein